MPKLDKIVRQLNGTDEKEKRSLDKSLSEAVGTNTNALSKQIEGMLVQFFGESNQSTLKISQSVANEIGKLVLGTHNNVNERLAALESAEQARHDKAQEMLKQIVGGLEESVLTSIRSTDGKVAKLATLEMPEPQEVDLGPVMGGINELSGKVSNIKMPEIPKRKDSFEFRVKRDDEGLITKVVVN